LGRSTSIVGCAVLLPLRRSAAAACAAVATCAPACSASEVNMRRILIAPRPLYVHIDVWPIAAAQEGAGRPAATSWPVLDGMPPRSRGKGKGATYARRIRAAPAGGSGIALINKYVAHSPASQAGGRDVDAAAQQRRACVEVRLRAHSRLESARTRPYSLK
jgi:hypothetical protein